MPEVWKIWVRFGFLIACVFWFFFKEWGRGIPRNYLQIKFYDLDFSLEVSNAHFSIKYIFNWRHNWWKWRKLRFILTGHAKKLHYLQFPNHSITLTKLLATTSVCLEPNFATSRAGAPRAARAEFYCAIIIGSKTRPIESKIELSFK